MSEPESQLAVLFADAFRQLEPKRTAPETDVRFYPYAGLHHTIRLRSGRVYVRVSDIFRDAPLNVHSALAFILVGKLLRRAVPEPHNEIYRQHACSPEMLRQSDLARRRRGRKMVSGSAGRTHDLDRMFARVNRHFFDSTIPKPTLTWSQRRTRRILGHHDAAHETIVISKTLDAPDVPAWFVEYILFHEMLHIKHPARIVDGRRRYHTKAFRAEEQRHPHYREAQTWLENVTFNNRRRMMTARAA